MFFKKKTTLSYKKNIYRNRLAKKKKDLHFRLLSFGLVALFLSSAVPSFLASRNELVVPQIIVQEPIVVSEIITKKKPIKEQRQIISSYIKAGETASNILSQYISPVQINAVSLACKHVYPLNKIRTGNPYTIELLKNDLQAFRYEIDDSNQLTVTWVNEENEVKIKALIEPIPYEVVRATVEGKISSNLFEAIVKAGEKSELAFKLADLFSWDIDFMRGLRKDDSFTIIVEKRSRNGEDAGYGHILAAKFINQGTTFCAYRYKNEAGHIGYYDHTGASLRKAFLKAPLRFTRISSGYSDNRLHPILKVWRPHHGIDYAAPNGTPIRTIGDGIVIAKAYGQGAGRYVKIQHLNNYETVYMHMSRYADGLTQGMRVRQGDVIGYVGTSGYATGPHLDFRIKKNGTYINPLTLKSPTAQPVPQKEKSKFIAAIAEYKKELKKPTPDPKIESTKNQITDSSLNAS